VVEKKSKRICFDFFEVLDMFMIKFNTGGSALCRIERIEVF
jgi:hypothetical protein